MEPSSWTEGLDAAVNLTWAEDDVKSWHSRSAHRAESTSMAPLGPHGLQMMRGGVWGREWVKSPVLDHSAPASSTGLSFTSGRAAAEWLRLWLGLNSDWRTVHGGEGGGVRSNEKGRGGGSPVESISDMEKMGRANI